MQGSVVALCLRLCSSEDVRGVQCGIRQCSVEHYVVQRLVETMQTRVAGTQPERFWLLWKCDAELARADSAVRGHPAVDRMLL